MKKMISALIDEWIFNGLTDLAKEEHRSKSQIIERSIQAEVEKKSVEKIN